MVPERSLFDCAGGKAKSNGNVIRNENLLSLPPDQLSHVLSRMEFTRLGFHQILCEAGETIESGYFVEEGVISVLAVQPDGKTVEVGLIGSEGFVGLPLLVGYSTSSAGGLTQGDGSAYRCDAKTLRKLMHQFPVLEQQLHRLSQRLAMQTTQVAACNGLHGVEERLARWILMSQDRRHSATLPLTHDFLAQMLGTRRASVTVAAGILEKDGLISCTRGNVTILNRQRLEDAACDCYAIVQLQLREWEAQVRGRTARCPLSYRLG